MLQRCDILVVNVGVNVGGSTIDDLARQQREALATTQAELEAAKEAAVRVAENHSQDMSQLLDRARLKEEEVVHKRREADVAARGMQVKIDDLRSSLEARYERRYEGRYERRY